MPPSGRSSGSRFAFLGQGRGAGQGRGGMVAGQGGAGQGWEQGSARGRAASTLSEINSNFVIFHHKECGLIYI